MVAFQCPRCRFRSQDAVDTVLTESTRLTCPVCESVFELSEVSA